MLRRTYLLGAILMAFLLCATTNGLAETNGTSEPISEYEYHVEEPLQFIVDHQGYISMDVFIEIYEEPQENENSDGFDAGYTIDWDEPLYYKGSTKEIWLTYNGYGIQITIDGPDVGLNTDVYVEIYLRHVNTYVEIHISTGIVPV